MNAKSLLKYEEVLLFIFASIGFFYGFYILAADFQDFSHLAKIVPAILAYWLPTYVLIVLHLIIHPASFKKLQRTYKINGIVLGLIGFGGAILVPAYVLLDIYHGFFQGFISPLFPFDILIIYIITFLLGAFLAHHGFKLKENPEERYIKPKKGIIRKIIFSIIKPLYLLLALYNFGAFLVGFDFSNYGSPTFGFMIPFYFLMFIEGALFLYAEICGDSEYDQKMSKKTNKIIAWSIFGSIILLAALAFAFFLFEPDYLIENAIAYYPLDFMGSFNIAPIITIVPPLLAAGAHVLKFYPHKVESQ